MQTYLGLDLVDTGIEYGEPGWDDEQSLKFVLLGSPVGARGADQPGTFPRLKRSFVWKCFSEADVAALRAFVDARKGRAVPFWLPSGTRDCELIYTISGASTGITFREMGYVAMHAAGNARRHWYISRVGQTGYPYYTQTALDNGDGSETADFGTPILGASGIPICQFLLLVRLADDVVSIEWTGRSYAEAKFEVIEVPNEVPIS